MATLTFTLTIGSTDATSDNLSVSQTDSLTVSEPVVGPSRVSVSQSAATTLFSSSVATDTFVYVNNTDATNFVSLKDDAGNTWGKIAPGETSFFCVPASTGFEMQADTAACIVEYAYYTRT